MPVNLLILRSTDCINLPFISFNVFQFKMLSGKLIRLSRPWKVLKPVRWRRREDEEDCIFFFLFQLSSTPGQIWKGERQSKWQQFPLDGWCNCNSTGLFIKWYKEENCWKTRLISPYYALDQVYCLKWRRIDRLTWQREDGNSLCFLYGHLTLTFDASLNCSLFLMAFWWKGAE